MDKSSESKDNIADGLKKFSVPIDGLNYDAANARLHDDKNIEAIKSSFSQFGQRTPIVVQQKNNIVRAGNGRLRAALELGWDNIAAIMIDDDDVTATAYAIADNRTGELATWDNNVLSEILLTLDDELKIGWDDIDLKEICPPDIPDNIDEIVPTPDDPVTKPGEIIELGDHRIICGSCTDVETLSRLFDGQTADMLFTSPPYALGSSASLRDSSVKDKKIYDVHDDNPDDWPDLMRDFWDASQDYIDQLWVVNIQLLANNKQELLKWMVEPERSDRLVDVVTWDKLHAAPPGFNRNVLISQFEWILLYNKKSPATRSIPLADWNSKFSNVYSARGQVGSHEFAGVHGATMPAHLPLWIMNELCPLTKSVFDPFSGTGTTMIAAETLGIKSFSSEISPAYCDVMVSRWEKITGKKANRLTD